MRLQSSRGLAMIFGSCPVDYIRKDHLRIEWGKAKGSWCHSASLPLGATKPSFPLKGWTRRFCHSDSQTCVSFVLHLPRGCWKLQILKLVMLGKQVCWSKKLSHHNCEIASERTDKKKMTKCLFVLMLHVSDSHFAFVSPHSSSGKRKCFVSHPLPTEICKDGRGCKWWETTCRRLILHLLARVSCDTSYSINDAGVCDVFGQCIVSHFYVYMKDFWYV